MNGHMKWIPTPPYDEHEIVTAYKHLMKNKYFHGNCIVFRRNLLFKKDIELYCNDTQLTSALLDQGPICYSSKILMFYRVGNKSIYSGASNAIKELSKFLVQEEVLKNFLNANNVKAGYTKFYMISEMLKSSLVRKHHEIPECYEKQISSRDLPLSKLLLVSLTAKHCLTRLIFFKLFKYLSYYNYCLKGIPKLPIVKLHWWRGNNFGDELSRYIVEKLIKNKYPCDDFVIQWVDKLHNRKLFAIGSLLTSQCLLTDSYVWGTGVLCKCNMLKAPVKLFPLNRKLMYEYRRQKCRYFNGISAVRGKLTRELLTKQGVKCPDIYGDPGILISRYYTPKSYEKKYKYGLILHWIHVKQFGLDTDFMNFHLVDIQRVGAKGVEDFIDELVQCEKVFTTSLHGLIVAQAYGIPAQWIKFSGFPIHHQDEDFKFYDYFSGVNQIQQVPIVLNSLDEIEQLKRVEPPIIQPFENIDELINSFPKDILGVVKRRWWM